jgi:PrtD family type I secretion system ABC transporter
MKKLIQQVACFSLVINVLWLAPAMFSLQLFDRVMTSQSKETLAVLMLGLMVAFVLTGLLEYVRGRLQGVMGNIVNDALAPEIARLTLREAAKRQGPVPMEGLRDVARLRNLFSAQGLLAVLDAPWALVFLAVIALAHVWLGIAAAFAALLMLGLAVVNDHMTRQAIEEVQREAGKTQRYLEQAMDNAEVAQTLGMGDSLVARWKGMSARLAELQGPTARRAVAMSAFIRVLRQAVQVLLQGLGAYLVLAGEATPGVMIASTMLLGRALAPIEQIVASWKVLAEGRLAYRRLNPLMKQVMSLAEQMALPVPTGRILVQGLVYRPPGSDRVIVAGVSLQLDGGESLAILGPSGAGKSTLVRLLTGLWTPTAGVVRLDGVDLAKWPREAVGPHIGYVPQDVELFAGTVAENIARMGPVVAPLVVDAARLAGVHDLILALPEGYDTVVDPHAALLSPGQRQRIALARALYGRPKLLVLDEPNSNLDGAGEAALAETLRQLRGKATVIVVTHRTTLTAHVDKLMVIEAGRATHFGPTREVMQALQAPRGTALPGGQLAPSQAAATNLPLTRHVSTQAPESQGTILAAPATPASLAPPQPLVVDIPMAHALQAAAAQAGHTEANTTAPAQPARTAQVVPIHRPLIHAAAGAPPVPENLAVGMAQPGADGKASGVVAADGTLRLGPGGPVLTGLPPGVHVVVQARPIARAATAIDAAPTAAPEQVLKKSGAGA